MSRQSKLWKRNYRSNLKKLAKQPPQVWRRMCGWDDWGVSGYTHTGYFFYGAFKCKSEAEAFVELMLAELPFKTKEEAEAFVKTLLS